MKNTPPPKQKRQEGERLYLTESEVKMLIAAAKKSDRHGLRNSTLILTAYKHGLRAGEIVGLTWKDVNYSENTLYVKRLKHGKSLPHPIKGEELRLFRRLQREYPDSPWIFTSERGTPLSTRSVRAIIAEAGVEAGLGAINAHALRHSTGFYLANKGIDTRTIQDYLGHRQIQHTVRYTDLAPGRFEGVMD